MAVQRPRTSVYIDAFNLYFGALKRTPYRWLDLEALCRAYLPGNDIVSIKYFTAKVSARENDPQQPVRQQAYLRAISTLPTVSVIYGHYLSHVVSARLASSPDSGSPYVKIIKTEEKGSDVNLATHLLHDAHLNRFDLAAGAYQARQAGTEQDRWGFESTQESQPCHPASCRFLQVYPAGRPRTVPAARYADGQQGDHQEACGLVMVAAAPSGGIWLGKTHCFELGV